LMECGFCGTTLSRRSWHSGTKYQKTTWQCMRNTKMGKRFCPDSKAISEEAIEKAFVESYRLLCSDNKEVVDGFIKTIEETLNNSSIKKELSKIEKSIEAIEGKKSKLIDMRLEETLDKESYDVKYAELVRDFDIKLKEQNRLISTLENEMNIKRRMSDLKKVLEKNEILDAFDRYVFESVVEKIIVGGIDDDGYKDPAQLTFVYKSGLKNNLRGENFKPTRKNSKNKLTSNHQSAADNKLCSDVTNGVENLCFNYRTESH
jgi:site-specific DNA recombinase